MGFRRLSQGPTQPLIRALLGRGVSSRPYYGWVLTFTLGVTETISWGVLYYAFSVLLQPMGQELGWSLGEMSGAFSLALLLNGLGAIVAGRWLDRHGPRLLMTAGSFAGVLLVLAWSHVADLRLFYLVWAAIGLVMAATLYDPAFATITAWFERRRVRALTVVTVFAGFASTIFLPLTGWLIALQGWRHALATLACVLAAGTVLPHALLLRRRPEDFGLSVDGIASDAAARPKPEQAATSASVRDALQSRSFPWLAAAFCLSIGVAAAVRVDLVSLLSERGYPVELAATLAGGVGAMQVLGRVFLGTLGERVTVRVIATAALGIQPLSLVVLALAPGVAGVVAFVTLFGAGYGATTLVRPALVAALFGRARYASIAGVLSFAVTLAQAAAPLAAGVAHDALGSYEPVLWGSAFLSGIAALSLLAVNAPELRRQTTA